MPVYSLVFNKLQVEIPTKEFSLSIDSSVSLQTPSRNTLHMKIKHILDLLCSGNVWVAHRSGCQFDFVIRLDSELEKEPGIEKMIQDVAAYVQETPLWSQVSLNAELKFQGTYTSNDSQFSLSIALKPAQFEEISAGSSASLSSEPQDVQVPMCVEYFQLRRIKIAMTFSSGRANQKAQPPLPNMDNSDQPASNLYPRDPLCQYYDMPNGSTIHHGMDIATPLLTTYKLTECLSALPSPPNSQEEKTCVMRPIISDLSRAREMVHLGLSKLIGGRQNKNRTGIKVVMRRPTLTLSRLAPSLFTPGFAEAMSQRDRFLPRISHSLSVSLMRNVQSPSLQRKLLCLVSNTVSNLATNVAKDPANSLDATPSHAESQTSRSPSRGLESSLWVMMQRSLNNPLLTRRVSSAENLTNNLNGITALCLGGVSTNGTEEADHITENSTLFCDQSLGFLEDDFEDPFEDLFEDFQGGGEHEEVETLLSEKNNERNTDDDFEDLFEDKSTAEHDGVTCAKGEGYDSDLDIIKDYNFRYWEYSESTDNADPLDECVTQQHDMLDVENEEMLI